MLVITGAGYVFHRSPAFLIAIYPQAFGFSKLVDGIYAERLSYDQNQQILEAVQGGIDRAQSFYSGSIDLPIVLVCTTAKCDAGISGMQGEKAKTYGTWITQISSRGIDKRTIAHELSHVELRRLIGYAAVGQGKIPAWFDEGLAVIVSKDDRYLKVDGDDLSCLVDEDVQLPTSPADWLRDVKTRRNSYANAACRVLHWMNDNGGGSGVINVLKEVGKGGYLRI